MTEKNFINFHVLISHSPSCLNRDDMNMQKTAIFGGHRRVRISSQSLKRAMRKSDYYRDNLGQPSTRTREIGVLREHLLTELGSEFDAEFIDKAIMFWVDERNLEEFNHDETPVAPWIKEEIRVLADLLKDNKAFADICDAFIKITGDGDTDKKKKRTQVNKAIKLLEKEGKWKSITAAAANAVDVALSGRMATSGLMTSVDGALSVAHSITTHPVDSDIDWFTAVDDLVEQGSGHLNSQEFSSGVFYRYASLNIRQLQENLGGASRDEALEIAKHVLHMLATVVPTAKNQSTAPFNLADFVMVSFSDQPVSLANAFEKPVSEKGGFLAPSIDALKDYWQKVHSGYGLDEKVVAFRLGEPGENPKTFASLPELEAWVRNNGQ